MMPTMVTTRIEVTEEAVNLDWNGALRTKELGTAVERILNKFEDEIADGKNIYITMNDETDEQQIERLKNRRIKYCKILTGYIAEEMVSYNELDV